MKFLLNLLIIISASSVSFSQIFEKPIYEIERDAHSASFYLDDGDYKSDTNINVTHYKLFLKVTYQPDYLRGEVTIKCKSLVNNLTEIFYDLADNMTVDSVHSGNIRLNFSHSDNKVLISLNNSFNTDQEILITVFYRGIPIPTGFGSFVFGSHGNNEPAIWTLSEPFGSSDWFPCKNVPFDKADSSDVWIQCSDDLSAVSNGVLKEIVNNNDGTLTFKWHNSYPIVNYVISLAISNYAQYNSYFKYSANDSMPVLNYIYPENLNELKSQLDKTNYMLELFSQKFGLYPFINEKYGHAEFGRNAGMENQTISSMGVFNDNIMAHELAHQWFGDKITCIDWQNIWLNEGFATYGEAVYNEAAFGAEAYKEFIKFKMSDSKNAVGSIYVQDVNNINQIFSGNRSYAKGCIVLHMLRGVVGDSAFFSILKSYATNPEISYKNAVTEDFKIIAESIYGNSLNYFFDEWIYGENYPKYSTGWI
ncbi:MAG TPA: M1 family metallopeptidase, partial [Ignavibacteria bacterium]|nr:M1 family metallopeptidase [Ignavibacteria bacterium]